MDLVSNLGRQKPKRQDEAAAVLLVPGINNSGPRHWQSHWEGLSLFRRVALGDWSAPERDLWVEALDRAVRECARPLVLAAHSLGCLAVAWWAKTAWSEAFREKMLGALLVAPPDAERPGIDSHIGRFAPVPDSRLPFPSILVASRNDPHALFERSERFARSWGSVLIDLGRAGHINADSPVGEWSEGLRLVASISGRNPNLLVAELALRRVFA
jgi:hypothetical protein